MLNINSDRDASTEEPQVTPTFISLTYCVGVSCPQTLLSFGVCEKPGRRIHRSYGLRCARLQQLDLVGTLDPTLRGCGVALVCYRGKGPRIHAPCTTRMVPRSLIASCLQQPMMSSRAIHLGLAMDTTLCWGCVTGSPSSQIVVN